MRTKIKQRTDSIEEITIRIDKLIEGTSYSELVDAQIGLGISSAKFAMRFANPETDQDRYTTIYRLFFDKVQNAVRK